MVQALAAFGIKPAPERAGFKPYLHLVEGFIGPAFSDMVDKSNARKLNMSQRF